MKKLIISLIFLITIFEIDAQTLIATSSSLDATANHNQRKIVRDSIENVYVVYVDSTEQGKTIKGLWLNIQTNDWSLARDIANGTNPSLAINKFGKFSLVFESNDSLNVILHTSSQDFINWTAVKVISDLDSQLPICDSDSTGKLNVFWIKNEDVSQQSLIYASVVNDHIDFKKTITTKSVIKDIAIANHLQNFNDDLIFSIQFDNDSLLFLRSKNNLEIDTLFESIGKQPCISYNSMTTHHESFYNDRPIRLLYINELNQLIEIECGLDHFSKDNLPTKIIDSNKIDFICIDDVIPPFGYSYLFIKNGNLYHGFSYGAEWHWNTILDTISANIISPSIAYKNFNSHFIDFIWMQKNNNHYDIYYKRDSKLNYLDVKDHEMGKGFNIIGYPNPFKYKLNIEVLVNNFPNQPILEIYDSSPRIIKTLHPSSQSENKYYYTWDANNLLQSGLYFIKCSVGKNTIIRKVIKI